MLCIPNVKYTTVSRDTCMRCTCKSQMYVFKIKGATLHFIEPHQIKKQLFIQLLFLICSKKIPCDLLYISFSSSNMVYEIDLVVVVYFTQ